MSQIISRSVLVLAVLACAPALAGSPFTLRAAGGKRVVVEWDRQAIARAAARGGPQTIRGFPLRDDMAIDMEIEPFSVTGPKTRFVLGRRGAPDEPLDFDTSSIFLFRGHVPDRPGSHVFLAFSDLYSTGYIDLGAGNPRHRIASPAAAGDARQIEVFETPPAPARPLEVPLCGTESGSALRPTASLAPSGPAKGLKHLELAVETDYEYFILFGDTVAATTYLTMMYAGVSDIYIRDVDTRVELSFVRIWDNPNDLFNDVDPSPLPDFRNYWNANMSGVRRDAAQLFSGRRDYPFGGQAYLSTLCGSSAYSVVGYAMGFFPDPDKPSPYNYDISVTAHELGHNSGTGHTHESPNNLDTCDDPLTTPQRGTIMAYCGQTWSGGNANRDLYFHSRIQQNMDAHIGSSSCVVDDCNLNGIADGVDIAQSTSDDLNSNNIPDECEDCNGNMILDDADIAGPSQDVDGNGVPDECQPDCNGNNIPDSKDIADATSTDAYGNDIPDECEADCDSDSISDFTEIQGNMPLDIDRTAVLDACQDCDSDGTPDLTELGGAHFAWVASGLSPSDLREFHSRSGVLTGTSSGGAGSQADEGHDLIVTPAGDILVTSAGDHRVMEFDSAGAYQGDRVASGGGGLSTPTGLAITPDGTTLLVASAGTNSVLAYALGSGTPGGAFVAAGSGGLVAPFGLVFGPNGNLFVTSDTNEVLEFDGQNGTFVGIFVPAAANGGLDQPRGLAFKPDGNLLVASFGTDEVLEYEGQSGAALGRWAKSGTGSALTQVSPWGIRVGPNGNVFVSRTGDDYGSSGGAHDHDQAELHLTNSQVYEFDARNGNFLRAYIGGNDHGLLFPTGFDFMNGWQIDCNLNQLQDSCDIALGFSADADTSGVPDECEVDCDSNGIYDRLDIIPYGTQLDCNNNFSPDACDTASATSQDCTGNGVPDECEADCNGNLVADSCDISVGTSMDCNGNGIPNECDVSDDFETDTGWTAGAPGDTATGGIWTRVDPNGTAAQPENDHTPGVGSMCFVTGQAGVGTGTGAADVDGGATTLLSPTFDLSGDDEARVGYWRWFSNNRGFNPAEDVMNVDVSNDGGMNWTAVEVVGPTGTEAEGGWFFNLFRVSDFVTPTADVVLRFVASDLGGESVVEAAVDDIALVTGCCLSSLDCDDGLTCTTGSCNPTGECGFTVDAGNCLIAGTCYADGVPNPLNACESCQSATGPSVWSPALPVEVAGVVLEQAGMTHLSWTGQGTGFDYDIVSGDLSVLRGSGNADAATCEADNVSVDTWDDTRSDPPSGAGYYYLVRSQKSCATGTYGAPTAGDPHLPLADCP